MKKFFAALCAAWMFVVPGSAMAQAPMVPTSGGNSALPVSLPANTPTLANQAYTTQPTDLGTILTVPAGSSDATITLMSAVTAGNGAVQYVQKSDAVALGITGAANNGSGLVRLTVSNTAGFITNQVYTINGIVGSVAGAGNGFAGNGTFPLTVVDSTHLDEQGSTFPVNGETYTSGGTINGQRVTVSDGTFDRAWLSTQGDIAGFQSNGSAWVAIGWNVAPLTQWWSATGVWTKPPLSTRVSILACGGSGGGGSGRRGLIASIRTGGGGAAGAFYVYRDLFAAVLNGTEPVTIGAGGLGGAAVTVDSTDGNVGVGGGLTTFGSSYQGTLPWLLARSGAPGAKGSATAQTGGVITVPAGSTNWAFPGQGANAPISGSATNAFTTGVAGGGGAGAGALVANTIIAGTAGGSTSSINAASSAVPGGAIGTSGVNGGIGTSNSGNLNFGGSGGGGGFWATSVAGTNGGNGARCAGGGGGAAADNGFNSGAGGLGGGGEMSITTVF